MSKKSKTLIMGTLLQLMEQDNFHDITVSEICAWAKIARRTFYNNFTSKESVLRECCRNIFHESILKYETEQENRDVVYWKGFTTHFFSTNQKNSNFFSKLLEQNLFHMYVHLVHDEVVGADCLNLSYIHCIIPEIFLKYALPSYITVGINMYEIWSTTGYQETPEELSDIYFRFIMAQVGTIP